MNHETLAEKLLISATNIDWQAAKEPSFESSKFRGRQDATTVSLPETVIGLRLGAYPLLVADIVLDDKDKMLKSLKSLHNQMVIARSYMRADEVINAHIVLCATVTSPQADWRGIIDLAERDEAVCRKVVWMPNRDSLDQSYDEFLARTFLAQPWRDVNSILDAPLDHNEGLAQRILVRHGLSSSVAERWVELAKTYEGDPDGMIPQLVASRERSE